jgi:glucose-6-phosphate isomerase
MTGALSGEQIGEKKANIGDLRKAFLPMSKRVHRWISSSWPIMCNIISPLMKEQKEDCFLAIPPFNRAKVGDEYFMTKGHFHAKGDRGEYYWCIKGKGMLIFMDRNRNTWAEEMTPASLHYMPARVAHRTVNTGNEPMTFGACWPSDAGHDYGTILEEGFSARLLEVDGKPMLVDG